MSDTLEDLPHFVGLPLTDHDQPPGVEARASRLHQPDLVRNHPLTLDERPPAELVDRVAVGHALHLGEVLPLDAVARVGDPHRHFPVVGQQDEPLRVVVEAAHRVDALADSLPDEVEYRRTSLGILRRRDDADRLVQQDVSELFRRSQALAVDLDGRIHRIGLVAERGGPTVDGHAAVSDQPLGLPSGAHARPGDQLLEAFKGHSHRLRRALPALPAWATRRAGRCRSG